MIVHWCMYFENKFLKQSNILFTDIKPYIFYTTTKLKFKKLKEEKHLYNVILSSRKFK